MCEKNGLVMLAFAGCLKPADLCILGQTKTFRVETVRETEGHSVHREQANATGVWYAPCALHYPLENHN